MHKNDDIAHLSNLQGGYNRRGIYYAIVCLHSFNQLILKNIPNKLADCLKNI